MSPKSVVVSADALVTLGQRPFQVGVDSAERVFLETLLSAPLGPFFPS